MVELVSLAAISPSGGAPPTRRDGLLFSAEPSFAVFGIDFGAGIASTCGARGRVVDSLPFSVDICLNHWRRVPGVVADWRVSNRSLPSKFGLPCSVANGNFGFSDYGDLSKFPLLFAYLWGLSVAGYRGEYQEDKQSDISAQAHISPPSAHTLTQLGNKCNGN